MFLSDVSLESKAAGANFPVRSAPHLGAVPSFRGRRDRPNFPFLRQRWLPAAWGMSIGALIKGDAVLPSEVSLKMRPAYSDALVLGVWARKPWPTSRCLPRRRPTMGPRPRASSTRTAVPAADDAFEFCDPTNAPRRASRISARPLAGSACWIACAGRGEGAQD